MLSGDFFRFEMPAVLADLVTATVPVHAFLAQGLLPCVAKPEGSAQNPVQDVSATRITLQADSLEPFIFFNSPDLYLCKLSHSIPHMIVQDVTTFFMSTVKV